MIGMDTVIAMRQQGVKPDCVFLDLMPHIDAGCPVLSPTGSVTVQIGPHESLSDLDLRPLVGLYVIVSDPAKSVERHRKLAAMVAEVNPSLLVMPEATADGYTVHRRYAGTPPRTETLKL
jgi:hypothetical protein